MFERIKDFYRGDRDMENKAERLSVYHPCIFCFLMFIGMPVGILTAVGIATALVVLPAQLIMKLL